VLSELLWKYTVSEWFVMHCSVCMPAGKVIDKKKLDRGIFENEIEILKYQVIMRWRFGGCRTKCVDIEELSTAVKGVVIKVD